MHEGTATLLSPRRLQIYDLPPRDQFSFAMLVRWSGPDRVELTMSVITYEPYLSSPKSLSPRPEKVVLKNGTSTANSLPSTVVLDESHDT